MSAVGKPQPQFQEIAYWSAMKYVKLVLIIFEAAGIIHMFFHVKVT